MDFSETKEPYAAEFRKQLILKDKMAPGLAGAALRSSGTPPIGLCTRAGDRPQAQGAGAASLYFFLLGSSAGLT
jgi:hypothetical protein